MSVRFSLQNFDSESPFRPSHSVWVGVEFARRVSLLVIELLSDMRACQEVTVGLELFGGEGWMLEIWAQTKTKDRVIERKYGCRWCI